MEIIGNNLSITHKHLLRRILDNSDELLCASPFISSDIEYFFDSLSVSKIKKLTLLTILKPNDPDQILKVKILPEISKYCKFNDIDFELYINNRLHGKVYLFKKNNKITDGIITSANFTENGMEKNLEWGIHLDIKDNLKLYNLISDVFLSNQNQKITNNQLEKLVSQYKIISKGVSSTNQIHKTIKLDLLSLLDDAPEIPIVENTAKFWLKPIGETYNPVTEDWYFGYKKQALDFSKKRPSGIHKDDIIIAYGVGCRKILSIYRITSNNPHFATTEEIKNNEWKERWPWSLEGENLTEKYGKHWNDFNFTITQLGYDFNRLYPQLYITERKGKTFGALNYGVDKLQLSQAFANFVLQKIFNANT